MQVAKLCILASFPGDFAGRYVSGELIAGTLFRSASAYSVRENIQIMRKLGIRDKHLLRQVS